jgi:DNA polymerase-3 subunit gamma/tau
VQVKEAPIEKKVVVSGKLRGGGLKLAGKSKVLAETRDSAAEGKAKEVDESWQDEVTQEGLKAAWDVFVEKQREAKRVSLVSTLSMCELELKGNIVCFSVVNALQEIQLDGEKTDLLYHLRKSLRNASLELSIEIIQTDSDDDEVKKYLTDKEKYVVMVEKNPSLDKLRKKLDLDLG